MRQKGQYFSLRKVREHPYQEIFLSSARFREWTIGVCDFKDEGILANIKVWATTMRGSG